MGGEKLLRTRIAYTPVRIETAQYGDLRTAVYGKQPKPWPWLDEDDEEGFRDYRWMFDGIGASSEKGQMQP